MSAHYSDPSRESEPHALPDVEVWSDRVYRVECRCGDYDVPEGTATAEGVTYCPSCERPAHAIRTARVAWWWWTCFPGCLPDSEPMGPFATEAEALADARDGMDEEDDDGGEDGEDA